MSPDDYSEHAREIIRAFEHAEIGPVDALYILSVAVQRIAHGLEIVIDRIEAGLPVRHDA